MKTNELEKLLPEGYEEACYETKAIRRKREIKNPETLMELCLLYLIDGLSLMEVSVIAKLNGIKISDVGFMKRFALCKEWFQWIISKMLPRSIQEYKQPEKLKKYRLIAVDASDVVEKGATGRIWRLHYGIDLFHMKSVHYKITTQAVGESLRNFSFQENDLVLGDRAYGTLVGIEHCVENNVQFVLRLRSNMFITYDKNGKRIEIENELEALEEGEALNLDVIVHCTECSSKAVKRPIRICAMKKTKEAMLQEERRIHRHNSQKQRTLSKKAIFLRNYVIVATSLPTDFSAKEVMELYRLRWQVELFFKRLKSILDFGDLPKRNDNGVQSWLNGKIMVALMIENALSYENFSPSDKKATGNAQPMA